MHAVGGLHVKAEIVVEAIVEDYGALPLACIARGVTDTVIGKAQYHGTQGFFLLVDDVKLERRSSEDDFIEVTTSALTLYPDRKYAETDQAVMIETHTGRTTAHGLRADLQTGQLTLYSGVHTVVLPETL